MSIKVKSLLSLIFYAGFVVIIIGVMGCIWTYSPYMWLSVTATGVTTFSGASMLYAMLDSDGLV